MTSGDELLRIQADIVRWKDEGKTAEFPEASDTVIEFIALVTEQEALVNVCEHDRGVIRVNGEVWDDSNVDSNFQARFVLVGSEWRWTETIKIRSELLDEGEAPLCMSASAT